MAFQGAFPSSIVPMVQNGPFEAQAMANSTEACEAMASFGYCERCLCPFVGRFLEYYRPIDVEIERNCPR